jgi:hypothetical protein
MDVHVTVVGPSGKVDPLAGVQLTGLAPSIASVAEAVKVNGAPAGPVASTVASAGTVTTGPTVSTTVTVKDAEPVLVRVSVALQVTDVVPIGNVLPLGGAQVAGRSPSTMSIADAVKVCTAPDALVAAMVALVGTVTTGGVMSRTVTVNVVCALLPRVSEALQLTVVSAIGNVAPLAGEQLIARAPSTASSAEAE